MSKAVLRWVIAGVVVGVAVGALLGWLFSSSAQSGNADGARAVFISWLVIIAVGTTLLFSLWGYANEQQQKVRRPDLFK